jgi:hypothetical protein
MEHATPPDHEANAAVKRTKRACVRSLLTRETFIRFDHKDV